MSFFGLDWIEISDFLKLIQIWKHVVAMETKMWLIIFFGSFYGTFSKFWRNTSLTAGIKKMAFQLPENYIIKN